MSHKSEAHETPSAVQYLNPATLNVNPAFSQVVTINGPVRTVYIGGQNAITPDRQIIGKGDLKAQVVQVMKNLELALEAGGAGLEHVIKWTIYAVQGQSPQAAFEAAGPFLQKMPQRPLISVIF